MSMITCSSLAPITCSSLAPSTSSPFDLAATLEVYRAITRQVYNAKAHRCIVRQMSAFEQIAPVIDALYASRSWKERLSAAWHHNEFDRDVEGFALDEPTQSIFIALKREAPSAVSSLGAGAYKTTRRLSYEKMAIQRLRAGHHKDRLKIESSMKPSDLPLLSLPEHYWSNIQRKSTQAVIEGILSQFSSQGPLVAEGVESVDSFEKIHDLALKVIQLHEANKLIHGAAGGWRWYAIALHSKSQAAPRAAPDLHLFFERAPSLPHAPDYAWNYFHPKLDHPIQVLTPLDSKNLVYLNRHLLQNFVLPS